jgi:hypothetical protein
MERVCSEEAAILHERFLDSVASSRDVASNVYTLRPLDRMVLVLEPVFRILEDIFSHSSYRSIARQNLVIEAGLPRK